MTATATVRTEKARRYMKAMSNHFGRKVKSHYEGDNAFVDFGFGRCEMEASDTELVVRALGESAGQVEGVKMMIARHLVQFGQNEKLSISWQ